VDGFQTHWVPVADGRLALHVGGDGPAVLLLPSLGRGCADFQALGRRLIGEGYRVLALQPRGIGESSGGLDGLDLSALAADALAALDHVGAAKAHVAGHAFGNRVARCLRADHPERVLSLTLLGAGGLVAPQPEAQAAFKRFINEPSSPEAFLADVALANFSPRSDPSPWADGWWTQTARAQARAAGRTAVARWWDPGAVDVLIVQGLDDAMAPPGNGRQLAELLGDRATLVEIEDAGHALLPEQPEQVAAALLRFLGGRRTD
jgi:pimeloyl-ACP methyl ester carboxylesterase